MAESQQSSGDQSLVISYMTLRKAIGFLGIILPLLLWLGVWVFENTTDVKPSISDYYYSGMRDVFVGILCGVALFLYAYKGPDREDRIAGYLGCIFALGVVFFPTMPLEGPEGLKSPGWIGTLHFICATLFFCVLVYFSLFLFTRHRRVMTEMKKIRNTVYHICAYIMIICMCGIATYFFFLEGKKVWLDKLDPVFYLESLALIAFGISWLVKGELILKDLKRSSS